MRKLAIICFPLYLLSRPFFVPPFSSSCNFVAGSEAVFVESQRDIFIVGSLRADAFARMALVLIRSFFKLNLHK